MPADMISDIESGAAYIPYGYQTPSFPSLRWPTGPQMQTKYYLYYRYDIWMFTLFWTLILYGAAHLAAGVWAALMNRRFKAGLIIAVYLFVGLIEAFVSASIIGAILGLVYSAGSFAMSTWIPFIWAVIQILTMIMISYSMTAVVM
ncbi:hypothetical protein V1525DRAFT_377268 [Lipomyces kononenkoae]|uniref:Uncharacterized protein n=1 Tax=Lipomyces kononenkoae TaxID=34357 RepID=A0ACC3T1F0_LIPKO